MASQAWTFGPGGEFTATWDGLGVVTVTLTAGGALVGIASGVNLGNLAAAQQAAAGMVNAPASPVLAPVPGSPVAGVSMINGTQTLLSWTAPNDGQLHRAQVFFGTNTTSALTGGGTGWTFTGPAGGPLSPTLVAAGQGVGVKHAFDGAVIAPGTTVTVSQSGAATAGAATMWADLWAA